MLDLSDSLKFCTDKKLKLQSSKACATKFIQFFGTKTRIPSLSTLFGHVLDFELLDYGDFTKLGVQFLPITQS